MSKTAERRVNVTVTYVENDCGDNPIFGVYEYLIAQKRKELAENVNTRSDESWAEVGNDSFEEGIAEGQGM